MQDYALEAIGSKLNDRGWVYLEGFLGDEHAQALRQDVEALSSAGRLQSGYLAGNGLGGGVRYVHNKVRGDEVLWSNGRAGDGDGEGHAFTPWGNPSLKFERGENTLTLYLKRMDTLVAELKDCDARKAPGLKEALGRIGDRSHAMLARYPPTGAGYVRHCDNHCDRGRGDTCNGRRLTCIVYLNHGWTEADGGELLLYR